MSRTKPALQGVALLSMVSLVGFALPAPVAQGATILTANLTKAEEPEPTRSLPTLTSSGAPRPLSSGTATFTINDAQTAMTMVATIFNIDVTGSQTPDNFDNLTAAHIHGPLAFGAPGTAGVVWGFFGAPDSDTNPDNLAVVPTPGGVGGTISSTWDLNEGNAGTTLTAQLSNLRNGLTYLNFHTVQFSGGEIRGQLLPEPGAVVLLPLMAAAATARRGRTR